MHYLRARLGMIRGEVSSWPIPVIVVMSVFQQVNFDTLTLGWTRSQALGIGLGGAGAFALVTLASRWITRGRELTALPFVLVWVAASAARVAVVLMIPTVLRIGVERPLGQTLELLLTTVLAALVSAIIADRQRQHARAIRSLAQRRTEVAQRLEHDSRELQRARADVQQAVEEQVRPVRQSCAQILRSAENDSPPATYLREQVESVLRPASLDLLRSPPNAAPESGFTPSRDAAPAPNTRGLTGLPTFAASRSALRPWWPIIAVATLTFIILDNIGEVTSPTLVYLIGLSTTILSIVAVTRAWRTGIRPRTPSAWAWLAILGAYAAAGALVVVVFEVLQFAGILFAPSALYLVLIVVPGMSGSLYAALRESQTRAEEREAVDIAQIAALDARLRREAWFERRRLAAVLHGRVQSRLVAAAGHLSADHDALSFDGARELVAEALAALNSLRDSHDGTLEDPGTALAEIASVWSTTMPVTLSVETDLRAWPPAAVAALLDVVTEGLLNARKHGDATTVDVHIGESDGMLEVTIDDDGIGISGQVREGSGSRFLDEMTADWGLVPRPSGGASLTVHLDSRRVPVAH